MIWMVHASGNDIRVDTQTGDEGHAMTPVQFSASEMAAMHKTCFPLRAWKEQDFEDLMQQHGVFWGVDHEKRGFILARAAGEEAEILTLAVEPEHRRQGVARDLVANVIQTCPVLEAKHLFLEVAADNDAASGLYKRLGFHEVGRRIGYYARGEAAPVDAVVMGRAVMNSHFA